MSRVTTKYQATIPLAVREALGIRQGDRVLFEISGGQVLLRRAIPSDPEFMGALAGTLSEWLSPEDEKAFGDL
ncbi:MAG: type II toxin-antitoxin system PrlF family antitoxin [Candidatus Sericytochromatia bacterium]|nr:type II toxin-antitoxin system PrlF family antitoxin [Candidatus Tanganyikabacteria bacterium]